MCLVWLVKIHRENRSSNIPSRIPWYDFIKFQDRNKTDGNISRAAFKCGLANAKNDRSVM